jgi:hypothetical protein
MENYIKIVISDFEFDSFSELITNQELYYATEQPGYVYSVEIIEESARDIIMAIEAKLNEDISSLTRITLTNVKEAIKEQLDLYEESYWNEYWD